jgi:hypothetical protein
MDNGVQTLSGGELQRCAIVLCLGTAADIYLVLTRILCFGVPFSLPSSTSFIYYFLHSTLPFNIICSIFFRCLLYFFTLLLLTLPSSTPIIFIITIGGRAFRAAHSSLQGALTIQSLLLMCVCVIVCVYVCVIV